MIRRCCIAAGVVLGLTLLVEIYFATVFNESVRHGLDLPAMLFITPGLLMNHFLQLRLPFDGPHHSAVIWISGAVYIMLVIGVMVVVRAVRNPAQRRQDPGGR